MNKSKRVEMSLKLKECRKNIANLLGGRKNVQKKVGEIEKKKRAKQGYELKRN